MTKFYIASKVTHAQRWIDLWSKFPDIHITSRWIFTIERLEENEANSRRFWEDDLADIAAADYLLCYGEPEENLRGALVEAGAALGLGKTIYLVGKNPGFGSWQHHPRVIKQIGFQPLSIDRVFGMFSKVRNSDY